MIHLREELLIIIGGETFFFKKFLGGADEKDCLQRMERSGWIHESRVHRAWRAT